MLTQAGFASSQAERIDVTEGYNRVKSLRFDPDQDAELSQLVTMVKEAGFDVNESDVIRWVYNLGKLQAHRLLEMWKRDFDQLLGEEPPSRITAERLGLTPKRAVRD